MFLLPVIGWIGMVVVMVFFGNTNAGVNWISVEEYRGADFTLVNWLWSDWCGLLIGVSWVQSTTRSTRSRKSASSVLSRVSITLSFLLRCPLETRILHASSSFMTAVQSARGTRHDAICEE